MSTELCHILLDKMPMDDIVKYFSSHSLITDDDLLVISFAPSEYLKSQLLLKCLQHLRLSVWLMIRDILHNTKSIKQVISQLMDGMVF